MVKCVRAFMKTRQAWPIAVDEFTKRRTAEGLRVVRIVNCYDAGDNVWAIIANIEYPSTTGA